MDESIEDDENINKLIFNNFSNPFDFNFNDLYYLNEIHCGQINVIKRFMHKPSREIIVAKITRLPSKRHHEEFKVKQFNREIQALRSVSNCENIVKFYV